MGHYLSEMACPRCRKAQCICPPTPDPNNGTFVIEGAQIVPWERANRTVRYFYKRFPSFEEAQQALPGHIDSLMTAKRTEYIRSMTHLKKIHARAVQELNDAQKKS